MSCTKTKKCRSKPKTKDGLAPTRKRNPFPVGVDKFEAWLISTLSKPTPPHVPAPVDTSSVRHDRWLVWAYVPFLWRYALESGLFPKSKGQKFFATLIHYLFDVGLIDIAVDPDQERLLAKADRDVCPQFSSAEGGELDLLLWVRLENPEPDDLEKKAMRLVSTKAMGVFDLARALGCTPEEAARAAARRVFAGDWKWIEENGEHPAVVLGPPARQLVVKRFRAS